MVLKKSKSSFPQTRVLWSETTTTIRKKKKTRTKINDDALEDADTEDARHTK